MPKPLAPVPLLAAVLLAPACVADVADHEAIGEAPEAGLSRGVGGTSPADRAMRAWTDSHPGPCKDACLAAAGGVCPWREVCDDTDFVECAGVTLTCAEAEDAGEMTFVGLSACWDRCRASH